MLFPILLFSVVIPFVIGADDAAVCSVESLYGSVVFKASQVHATIEQATRMTQIVGDIVMTNLKEDTLFLPPMHPSKLWDPPAKLDLSPNRTREEIFVPSLADKELNITCAYNVALKTPGLIASGLVPFSILGSCLRNRSHLITDICSSNPHYIAACPGPSERHVRAREWRKRNKGFCPTYCLDPQRYNNSYDVWWNMAMLPLELIALPYFEKPGGLFSAIYASGPLNQNAYYPAMGWTMEQFPVWEQNLLAFFMSPETLPWTVDYPVLTEPYVDGGASKLLMISSVLGVMYGGEYLGSIGVDMQLTGIAQLLDSYKPAKGAMSMITSRGAVIMATQSVWNALFCPSPICDANGNLDWKTTGSTKLSSSARDDTRKLAPVIAQRLRLQEVQFNGNDMYAASSIVPGVSVSWTFTTLVPKTVIDNSARWNIIAPASINDVDRTSTRPVSVNIALVNEGTSTVKWQGKVAAPDYTSIMPASGILRTGQTQTLNVSFIPASARLAAGDKGDSFVQFYVEEFFTGAGRCFPLLSIALRVQWRPIYETYVMSGVATGVIISTSVLVILFGAVSAFILLSHGKDPMIKAASPVLLVTSIIGAALTAIASITFAVLPGNDVVCQLRWLLTPLGIMTLVAPLIMKTWRIQKIFASGNMAVKKITNRDLMLKVLVMQMTVLALYILQLIVPSFRSRFIMLPSADLPVSDPNHVALLAQCTSDSDTLAIFTIAVLALVTLWGASTAYGVRDVPNDFNESVNVAAAIGTLAAFSVLLVPIQFLTGASNPIMLVVTRSMALNLGIGITMTVMLLPKLVAIHTGKSAKMPDTAGHSKTPIHKGKSAKMPDTVDARN